MDTVKRIPISKGSLGVQHPVMTEQVRNATAKYYTDLMAGKINKSTPADIRFDACDVSIDPLTGESEVCPHGMQFYWSDGKEQT